MGAFLLANNLSFNKVFLWLLKGFLMPIKSFLMVSKGFLMGGSN